MRRLAAATVLALAALSGCTTQSPTADGSSPTTESPTPSPTPTASPTGPALELGGVFVPVPERMLDPANVRCGTAVRDAAHVVDPADPVLACAAGGDFAHITEVVLSPLRPVGPLRGSVAGRAVDVRTFPGHGVRLVVRSPSAERAKALADGAFVVDDPDGCPIHAADLGQPPEPKRLGSLAITRAPAATVCGYRRGRLTQSQTLTEPQSHALTAALWAAPTEGVIHPCPYDLDQQPAVGYWVVMLHGGGRIWQQHMACIDVLVTDDGTFAGVTNAMVGQLSRYAQGPVSVSTTRP